MILYESVLGPRSRSALAQAGLIIGGSLLLAVSARISVPFFPVPMSMQTLAVIALGMFLGPVRGAAAVLAYLAEGAAGLPVFAGAPQQGLGLAYMAGPTGGFLVGFVLQALAAGALFRLGAGRSVLTAVLAGLVAGAAVYPTGLLWLGFVIGFDKPLLAMGLFPFIPGDIMKAALAALLFVAGSRVRAEREEN